MKKYLELVKEKQYIKLIIANMINRFGDSIDTIAYMWLVYKITGKASWPAIIFAFNKIPTVLLQPFVGVWVEKRNKKIIMVSVDVIRALLIIILITLYKMNFISNYMLLIFTLCTSIAETFRLPSAMAFFPSVLKEEKYKCGISLNSTISTLAELIGLSLAGVIIELSGVIVAIMIDGVTFVVSAGIIAGICCCYKHETEAGIQESYLKRLKNGLLYIKRQTIIINFILLAVSINAMLVPINSLLIPLVQEEVTVNFGGFLVSEINMAITLGMIIGSFFSPALTKDWTPTFAILLYGEIVSVCYILLSMIPKVVNTNVLYCVCFFIPFLFGGGISIINVLLRAQLMKNVDKNYLSRVSAIFYAGASGITPIVSGIVSLAVNKFHISSIYFFCGVICVLVFVSIKVFGIKFEREEEKKIA